MNAKTVTIALVAAVPAFATPVAAQEYPAKPVRVLVGFAPGGGIDSSARAFAPALGAALGKPVIVENRPGAGSNIAAEIAAKAAPDGYTLLLGSIASLAINPSLKEFVALAKRSPGQITYATPGAGSSAHLSGELLKKVAGIDIVAVPYKGGGQAVVDSLAGHVPVFFASVPVVITHVAAGRLKAIAVTTGKRAAAMPDVPTVAEAGYPGCQIDNWYGLVAPAGTPRAVIDRLNREVTVVLLTRDVVTRIRELGHDTATSTPEQFGALIKSEIARWAKVVKEIGASAS
jgi:tripartite-type tricarboxylate transporter receptor subunit TctC